MTEQMGEDAFAERIAKPLRAPVRRDATFEARAMSAVHAAAREHRTSATSRSWWLRPRRVHVSPLATLAVAAGFVALVLAGSSLLSANRRDLRQPSAVATQHDTVHLVRFVFVDTSAHSVALVGAFNHWQKGATLLRGNGNAGVWTVDIPLEPGRHEYAFIVYDEKGERWVADPLSELVRDDFGTESSVVSVGARASS